MAVAGLLDHTFSLLRHEAMMMHIVQYRIHILPDRAEEVMYGGDLAMVIVLHDHSQSDLSVREYGQHGGMHEAPRVALGASTEHLGWCRRAVVVA